MAYEEENFDKYDLLGCLNIFLLMNLFCPFVKEAFTDFIKCSFGDSVEVTYPNYQRIKIFRGKKVFHLAYA